MLGVLHSCPHRRAVVCIVNKMLETRMISEDCQLVRYVEQEEWEQVAVIFKYLIHKNEAEIRSVIGRDLVVDFHDCAAVLVKRNGFEPNKLFTRQRLSIKLPPFKTVCQIGGLALALCLIVAVPMIWGVPSWSNEEVVVTKQEWNEMKEKILAMQTLSESAERERNRLFHEKQAELDRLAQVEKAKRDQDLEKHFNHSLTLVDAAAQSGMERVSEATEGVVQFCEEKKKAVDTLAGQFMVKTDSISGDVKALEIRVVELRKDNNQLSELSKTLDGKVDETKDNVLKHGVTVTRIGDDVLDLDNQVALLNNSVNTLATGVEIMMLDVYTAIIIVACFATVAYYVWDNYIQPSRFQMQMLTGSHSLARHNAELTSVKRRLLALEKRTTQAVHNPHFDLLYAGLVKTTILTLQGLIIAFAVAVLAPRLIGTFAESSRDAFWRFLFRF